MASVLTSASKEKPDEARVKSMTEVVAEMKAELEASASSRDPVNTSAEDKFPKWFS